MRVKHTNLFALRQEDSLRLFRTIVDSPILKDVNIILLLNKVGFSILGPEYN